MVTLIIHFFFQTFLQASGKVSKKKSMNKPRSKVKKTSDAGATSSTIKNNEPVNLNETASRPGTASSVGRKVEELFQVSKTYYLLMAICSALIFLTVILLPMASYQWPVTKHVGWGGAICHICLHF